MTDVVHGRGSSAISSGTTSIEALSPHVANDGVVERLAAVSASAMTVTVRWLRTRAPNSPSSSATVIALPFIATSWSAGGG
jgi:hypothetical protein